MDINRKVGELIRKYRNANHLSLEELAHKIHKSKSSMSKYEQGLVKIDLQTLEEIACALKLPLQAFLPESLSEQYAVSDGILQLFAPSGERAEAVKPRAELYLYFYGGELMEVRTALIELDRTTGATRMYVDPYEKKGSIGCSFFYCGDTIGFDSKYRMHLYNHYDRNDVFYLQFADAMSGSTTLIGLLSHFAAGQFNSFSAKCLLSKTKLDVDEELRATLRISREELQTVKKRNALYGSSRPQVFGKRHKE